MFEYDEMKIYRGGDIQINPKVIVLQPTLNEIIDFGEQRYFSAIHTLTSVGADLKWQLWDLGIDYTEIEDYDLFVKIICQILSGKRKQYEDMTEEEQDKLSEEERLDYLINPMQLILKDFDFADFIPCIMKENNQVVLYNQKEDLTIGRATYSQIVDAVRRMHGFKRNNEMPANERTKMDLIEDARDDAMAASKKPYKSALLPLISTLEVVSGHFGDDAIFNMKIGRLFYDIKRLGKVRDADLLLEGAYSGFASLKGVDKNRLDIFSEIEN